jgi:hypothetical protein
LTLQQVNLKNVLLFSIAMSLILSLGCGNGDEQTEEYVAPPPEPEILDMPSQKMAVVYTKGDPSVAGSEKVPAIFASVNAVIPYYKEKGIEFPREPLRARWPDLGYLPREEWTGIWGLPIPFAVDSLPQEAEGVEVKIEVWEYGKVAQILHLGPYATEGPSVERLKEFVAKSGYEIIGTHEEEYLTLPGAPDPKTIIRYRIREK